MALSGVREEYIQEFLPVSELPALAPVTNTRQDGSKDTVIVQDNDLFLVSQLCAFATPQQPDSFAVSKKLRYGDFKQTLSVDMGIISVKTDISSLSASIDGLSSEVDRQIADLSSEVSGNYVHNYVQTRTIFDPHTEPGKVIREITLSNGQIVGLKRDDISSHILFDGWEVAAGTVLGDYYDKSTIVVTNATTTEIRYVVKQDCYLNIDASIWESDDQNTPIEVYIHNIDLDNNEFESKLDQFNNPGGFSGKKFYNYYYSSLPIKSRIVNGQYKTVVIIRHKDGSAFKYDPINQSKITFTAYKFYATISRQDLSSFVPIDDNATQNNLGFYKFETNKHGLIVNCVSAEGYPVVGKQDDVISAIQTLGLKMDASERGYVTQPSATANTYGTVKVSDRPGEREDGPEYTVVANSSGALRVQVPRAEAGKYGTIKPGNPDNYNEVYIDTDGVAKVRPNSGGGSGSIEVATKFKLGGIKIGFEESNSGTDIDRNYAVKLEANTNRAYVNVPWTVGGGSSYVLPAASNAALGGIKIGYSTDPTRKLYAVKTDSNNRAYVEVPWEGEAYVLPEAAATTLGGIKTGYTSDDEARNYAVEMSGKNAYVHVPWNDSGTSLLESFNRKTQVAYCAAADSDTYIKYTIPQTGWYQIRVVRQTNDLYNTNYCRTEIQLVKALAQQNVTVWVGFGSYLVQNFYFKAGYTIYIHAERSTSETAISSGEVTLYKLEK